MAPVAPPVPTSMCESQNFHGLSFSIPNTHQACPHVGVLIRDTTFRKMTNRNQTKTNETATTETKYQTDFILTKNTTI